MRGKEELLRRNMSNGSRCEYLWYHADDEMAVLKKHGCELFDARTNLGLPKIT
jgi:hypothetical protein